jgi:hypothetical protein
VQCRLRQRAASVPAPLQSELDGHVRAMREAYGEPGVAALEAKMTDWLHVLEEFVSRSRQA